MKIGKHVIFLGAGASNGSGYPLANDLRLLVASRNRWEQELVKYETKYNLANRPIRVDGMAFWDRHAEALNLFRNGGFGTLDEFCKLAGGFQFQDEINGLRQVVRAALGLFNPEESFEKSEYYGFVQSLFDKDLVTLRKDVTVLTYNYDPYLEFLLYRAIEQRWKVRRRGKSLVMTDEDVARTKAHQNMLNAVTSGFFVPGNDEWLDSKETEQTFRVLKLHGAIGLVTDQVADFECLFTADAGARAERLLTGNANRLPAPVLFPWEIMSDKGFVEKEAFPLQNFGPMYPLLRRIWERARYEVQAAEKISFVGLSMHSYLLDGLKHLFKGKKGIVEVVVANTDNTVFVPGRTETHWNNIPHSPAFAVAKVLAEVAPEMKRVGIPSGRHQSDGDITLVKDFASFVKTQMAPVLS